MRIKSRPVLWLVLAVVALCVGAIEWYVLRRTGGIFMYPLDDTFIHMALAKNLAMYGNWGINPYEFASASSSVLYTLVLAGLFKLFGVHVVIPFLINCVAGVLLLTTLQRWLQKEQVAGGGQLLIILCVVVLTPVPILLIIGMEHTLQCLFSFLFLMGYSNWLEGSLAAKGEKWKLPWPVLLYGMMVVFARYEGLFLVAIACLILAWHRKMGLAIRLGLFSLLPLLIFGIYSVSKGSYFLPNSVLLKSDGVSFSINGLLQFLDNILVQRLTIVKTDNLPIGVPRPGISLLATQRLLIVLPLVWLVFLKYIRQRAAYGYMLGVLLACTILQLAFAATGWLYRYEAYLIFCSAAIVALLFYKYGKAVIRETSVGARWIMAVAVFALGFPFVLRSAAAFSKTGTASVNIYQQQYQMGQFLHTYYDRDVIAANDIGAVSFFTSGRNIDLWGLGNIKVARSRKNKTGTADFLDSLCRKDHAGTAVVYEKWFSDSLLHRWRKIATWQIRNNVICGDDTVTFFSISDSDGPGLKRNLREFEPYLPQEVTAKYYY